MIKSLGICCRNTVVMISSALESSGYLACLLDDSCGWWDCSVVGSGLCKILEFLGLHVTAALVISLIFYTEGARSMEKLNED